MATVLSMVAVSVVVRCGDSDEDKDEVNEKPTPSAAHTGAYSIAALMPDERVNKISPAITPENLGAYR